MLLLDVLDSWKYRGFLGREESEDWSSYDEVPIEWTPHPRVRALCSVISHYKIFGLAQCDFERVLDLVVVSDVGLAEFETVWIFRR